MTNDQQENAAIDFIIALIGDSKPFEGQTVGDVAGRLAPDMRRDLERDPAARRCMARLVVGLGGTDSLGWGAVPTSAAELLNPIKATETFAEWMDRATGEVARAMAVPAHLLRNEPSPQRPYSCPHSDMAAEIMRRVPQLQSVVVEVNDRSEPVGDLEPHSVRLTIWSLEPDDHQRYEIGGAASLALRDLVPLGVGRTVVWGQTAPPPKRKPARRIDHVGDSCRGWTTTYSDKPAPTKPAPVQRKGPGEPLEVPKPLPEAKPEDPDRVRRQGGKLTRDDLRHLAGASLRLEGSMLRHVVPDNVGATIWTEVADGTVFVAVRRVDEAVVRWQRMDKLSKIPELPAVHGWGGSIDDRPMVSRLEANPRKFSGPGAFTLLRAIISEVNRTIEECGPVSLREVWRAVDRWIATLPCVTLDRADIEPCEPCGLEPRPWILGLRTAPRAGADNA